MRPQPSARSSAHPLFARVETVALYGAFALIAAIVFGTVSVHPF